MKYTVPFVSNTPDDLHCLQSAYLMILKYFVPNSTVDMDQISKITGYEQGKGTWATAGLLWFKNHGFSVQHIEIFDYVSFIKDAETYLIKLAGPKVGQWQIEHTNIPLEQKRAKELLKSGVTARREPTIQDIKNALNNGKLARATVNSCKLNDIDGYFGHAVVVIGYDKENLIIHDPGSPAKPNRQVSYKDFEAAWADPNKECKELDIIGLPRQ